jgi:hypothetical protein
MNYVGKMLDFQKFLKGENGYLTSDSIGAALILAICTWREYERY